MPQTEPTVRIDTIEWPGVVVDAATGSTRRAIGRATVTFTVAVEFDIEDDEPGALPYLHNAPPFTTVDEDAAIEAALAVALAAKHADDAERFDDGGGL